MLLFFLSAIILTIKYIAIYYNIIIIINEEGNTFHMFVRP